MEDQLMPMLVGLFPYWVVITLMLIGLYTLMSRGNLVKKLIGLSIFQTSVFTLYIAMAWVTGGAPPILREQADTIYVNPLPHVLILTAIVVGVATSACGYAIIVRIREAYGSIEEDLLLQADRAAEYLGVGELPDPHDYDDEQHRADDD